MGTKLKLIFTIIFLIGLESSILPKLAHSVPKPKEYSPELKKILERSGEYCERIKDIALLYVCKEKIVNTYYKFQKTKYWDHFFNIPNYREKQKTKKTLTYDYQLIKKQDELTERRILIEENGVEKYDKNIGAPPLKYFSRYIVYGPVGFLSQYWQDYFHYYLLREEKLNGQECYVIQAVPTEPREENYNKAEIWVDREDYSILKIRWSPVSIQNYEETSPPSVTDQFQKDVIWTVTYRIEKNKVQFPDKQVIKETITNTKGKEVLWDEIVINYMDYKFFVVETKIDYK